MAGAIRHQPAGSPARDVQDRIIARRGTPARNIAKTAAARYLLTCLFYAPATGRQMPGRPDRCQRCRVTRPPDTDSA